METAHFILDCFRVLSWPIAATLISYWYRDVIRSLLPGAKITLTIVGLKAEATIPEIKASVEESLGGEPLTPEQRKWLQDLFREGAKDIQRDEDRGILRPLRDSGLIRTYPKREQIAYAKGVEITTLGRLLVRQNLA
jgi:hypothetical protein